MTTRKMNGINSRKKKNERQHQQQNPEGQVCVTHLKLTQSESRLHDNNGRLKSPTSAKTALEHFGQF